MQNSIKSAMKNSMQNPMNTLRYAFITLLALPLLLSCAAGKAQSLFPGVRIGKGSTNLQDITHPGITNIQDFPSIFKDALDRAWPANKAQIDQIMQESIADGNKTGLFPKGYTIYHQKSSVATSGTLQTSIVGTSVVLKFFVPNNYLEATTTVPANFAGASLDPRFSFTYDLTFSLVIPLVSTAQGLQITSASVTITNVSKPDSHNVTADLGLTIGSFVKIFGGPDFLAQFQQRLNGTKLILTQQVQQSILPVNSLLQQLSQQSYMELTTAQDMRTRLLVIRAMPANTTLKFVMNRINDMVNVDPKYRNLIRTFAKVRIMNTDVTGQASGVSTIFARNLPIDVRIVPIHIDIQRNVRIITTGLGASTKVEPEGVKDGIIRSIDLSYDRATGQITGSVDGQTGREIRVLSDRINGATFEFTLEDNGPKPAASRLPGRPDVGPRRLNIP